MAKEAPRPGAAAAVVAERTGQRRVYTEVEGGAAQRFFANVRRFMTNVLETRLVGTGLWIAGGNSNVVRYNRFYDNWRRGTMLFAVPNALICGPTASGPPVTGCSVSDHLASTGA